MYEPEMNTVFFFRGNETKETNKHWGLQLFFFFAEISTVFFAMGLSPRDSTDAVRGGTIPMGFLDLYWDSQCPGRMDAGTWGTWGT